MNPSIRSIGVSRLLQAQTEFRVRFPLELPNVIGQDSRRVAHGDSGDPPVVAPEQGPSQEQAVQVPTELTRRRPAAASRARAVRPTPLRSGCNPAAQRDRRAHGEEIRPAAVAALCLHGRIDHLSPVTVVLVRVMDAHLGSQQPVEKQVAVVSAVRDLRSEASSAREAPIEPPARPSRGSG